MTWREKIADLRRSVESDEKLMLVFDTAPGVAAAFVEELKRTVPFVPDSYLEFLRTTDGAQLDYFVLFGSGKSQFPSLSKARATWREVLDPASSLVIGSDASGSALTLRKDRQVYLIGSDPPDPERAQLIAQSFDELLDEVLMGPRYETLFPFGMREDNDWLKALVNRRWIPRT